MANVLREQRLSLRAAYAAINGLAATNRWSCEIPAGTDLDALAACLLPPCLLPPTTLKSAASTTVAAGSAAAPRALAPHRQGCRRRIAQDTVTR